MAICLTALGVVAGSNSARADGGPQDACAGDVETLTWTPAADTSGFIGYHVEQWGGLVYYTLHSQFDVGLDQTSAPVTLIQGTNYLFVYASTSADPKAQLLVSSLSGSNVGGFGPMQMIWNLTGSSVGDGTANVTYLWNGAFSGEQAVGFAPYSTQETVSGAGQSYTFGFPILGGRVTATFNGLTDGQPYTFTGHTFNKCGDAGLSNSPTYIPGISPVWTADTPPATTHPGAYFHQFQASGKPAPTYQLVSAPSWLHLQPNGLVYGVIPHGTSSFTYSLTAYNGVGILPYSTNPYVPVGPFTVTVKS
jgi:hypothetical protein